MQNFKNPESEFAFKKREVCTGSQKSHKECYESLGFLIKQRDEIYSDAIRESWLTGIKNKLPRQSISGMLDQKKREFRDDGTIKSYRCSCTRFSGFLVDYGSESFSRKRQLVCLGVGISCLWDSGHRRYSMANYLKIFIWQFPKKQTGYIQGINMVIVQIGNVLVRTTFLIQTYNLSDIYIEEYRVFRSFE